MSRRTKIGIVVLAAVWVGLMAFRTPLRARWWAWRLRRTDSPVARGHYFARLVALREDAVSAVAPLMDDPSPQVRALGAAVLKFAGGRRACELLRSALHDSDTTVRQIAAIGLAMHQDPRAMDELRKLLASDDPAEAAAAVVGLGRIGGEQAVALLIRTVRRHPAVEVRAQAMDELSRLRARQAVPVLIELLDDLTPLPSQPLFDPAMEQVRGLMQQGTSAGRAEMGPRMPALTWPGTLADQAARALREITGESFGFRSSDPPERRKAAIRLWRQWYQAGAVGRVFHSRQGCPGAALSAAGMAGRSGRHVPAGGVPTAARRQNGLCLPRMPGPSSDSS